MNTHSRLRKVPVYVMSGAAVVFTAAVVFGRANGVFNGDLGAPPNMTTALPSCGAVGCHMGFPNATVNVQIQALQSISKGLLAPVTVSVTGGVNSNFGGFLMTSDLGKFTAGVGTATDFAQQQIAHSNPFSRSWSFQFSSTTTGLAQWFTAANTVNGNNQPTGDLFGFYGPDATKPGVPFRVFVNDDKVNPFGSGCPGSNNLEPIVGIANNAARGQNLTVEVVNVPPGKVVLTVLGFSNTSWGVLPLPLPLAAVGAPKCSLRVSYDLPIVGIAQGTGIGGGMTKTVLPLPNLAVLQNLPLHFQALVLDASANGALSTSAGLTAIVQ